MTRKQAMMAMILLPLATARKQADPEDQSSSFDFTIKTGTDSTSRMEPGFLIGVEAEIATTFILNDLIEKDHVMLEIHADGRVASFTAREIMDALCGDSEPQHPIQSGRDLEGWYGPKPQPKQTL